MSARLAPKLLPFYTNGILSLGIYTNIVINFHNTCYCFISAALFCISVYLIIVTLVVVAPILHKMELK